VVIDVTGIEKVLAATAVILGAAWALGRRRAAAAHADAENSAYRSVPRAHVKANLLGYMQGFDDARSSQN
jgi:hypothetical protein